MERINEIERAANTILAQARTYHPEITEWAATVANDPTYTTHMPTEMYLRFAEYTAEGEWTMLERGIDRAVAALAHAVVSYRQFGRPEGDYEVGGFITSLAAAVAEYAVRVSNAYVAEVLDVQ